MKALTPDSLTQTARSLRLPRFAVPTFRPQPRDPPDGRFEYQSPQSPSGNYPLGLLSFLSISRMDCSLMNARALRVRFSKSLASRRHRLSHAKVRSTTQRLGRTSKPCAVSERLTISTDNSGNRLANAARNFGPW